MPRKEIASRGGFRMSPHIRQSHPHNYWVGKGKDKHLEVRYLKSIKVKRWKEGLHANYSGPKCKVSLAFNTPKHWKSGQTDFPTLYF